MADSWNDRAYLRGTQYKTDTNLAARQSIYAYQQPYHVPEPAGGLRELRRVTRPGGRVVIVLNGASHLRQLRAAIAAALGGATAAGGGAADRAERVTLDDGESLARSFFGHVARHDFTTELRVQAPGPIADYVRSLPGARHGSDPEDLAATVAATFPRTPEGHYLITAHTGCLICLVD